MVSKIGEGGIPVSGTTMGRVLRTQLKDSLAAVVNPYKEKDLPKMVRGVYELVTGGLLGDAIEYGTKSAVTMVEGPAAVLTGFLADRRTRRIQKVRDDPTRTSRMRHFRRS